MKNPAVKGVSWPAVEWTSDEKVRVKTVVEVFFLKTFCLKLKPF